MSTLPYLGLGLSTNAQSADAPHPFALLDAHPGLFDYLEYSAPLDVNEARAQASLFPEMERRLGTTPLVYHPVHLNLFGAELESRERLLLAAEHVKAVKSAWVSNDVGWWHHAGHAVPGYLYLTPPLTSDALATCVKHVVHVRDAMPVPLLVENPFVMTPRGDLHVLDFMERLSRQTGCLLLVDLGHLLSHQLARGLALDEGLANFPWERVAQLHLAGGVVTGRTYADDHPQPIRDETWALYELIKPRCTNLRAVTYEGDGHPDPIARRVLERLRKSVPSRNETTPGLSEPVEDGPKTALTFDAWSLFTEVHSTPGPELDFRLAVLAQHLDAEIPVARAAVAPTLSALARFTSSPSFRDWFERGTRGLGDGFLNWAMLECRRPELAGADALVSLELWARNTMSRSKEKNAVEAVFPVDLTEAVHAAYALKRHLGSRGLFSGEGWDGVLQCARRAEKKAWSVTLSVEGARVVVTPRS